ncbi:Serine/threonine-protein kinase atr [Halotydeus destructor]|nr:Serine/threonine-protein kinase atr [Halotydeus destructor]
MKFVSLLKIAKFCEADMTGLLHKPDIKYEVCKLVESLMYESLNAEDDVKIAVAEALGAIGALDPFWFDEVPLSQGMPSDEKTKRLEVNHQRFPGVLIEKLCDLLNRRTEVNYMLTVQFVLQELLKTFKFSPKQLETIGLSNYAQMICEPLFSSEYSHPKDEWEVTAPPIFNLNKSFECWINEWTRTLIKLMPNELPKRVFESLSHMFSFDASFTQWVLQFVVKEFLLNEGIEHTDKELYFLQEINQIVKTSLPFASQGHLTGPKSSLVEFKVSFTSVSLQSIQHRCAQTIFSLYDLFAKKGDKYFRIVLKYISEVEDNENWCLSKSDLATLAFASQAYHRALKLLEEHLSSEQRRLGSCYRDIQDDQYVLMQKIYIALDETDGVFGLIAKRKKPPSLSDEIIEYEAAGDLQEALSCAENGLSRDHDDLDSAKTFLRCALSLGQERTALIRAQHMVTSKPKWKSNMLPLQVEAAWKLGSWSELENYVNEFRDIETANTTSIAIGQLLHCIKSRDEAKFARVMKDVRRKEMGPISAAVMEAGSYVRSYQHLVRLHILTDIEKAAILHFSKLDSSELAKHYKTWENRKKSIDYIQQNTRYVENVSSFHRVFMNLNNPELHTVEILKSWLNSAKVSRKSGNLHLAHKCLMEIDGMCRLDDLKSDNVAHGMDLIADVVIEKAKHLWSKDDPSSMEKALKCLKNGANEHFRELTLSHRNSPKSDPNYSRLVLLHTIYADQMHNTSSGEIIEGYKESIRHNDRNEEAFFRLAKLYEKMASANLNDENSPAHLQNACKNFFRSLKCGGYKHTYEALPRLLTCWFDLGMRFKPRETKFFQEIHESVMLNIRKTVPGYILYSSLSQMLSRLCHRNQAVRKTLCDIIRSIAQDNPHQIAWKLIHVYFSTDEERQNACEKIMDSLNTYGSDKVTIKQIWLSYKDFGAALIKFKDYKFHLDQNHRATLDDDMDMAKYFTAVKKGKQCRILLPMTETLKERVPFKTEARGFGKTVYIREMNPVVVVMQSKVKPIKITFKGDDGREHSLLYKPSDDLRMDARAMEFIDVVNRHLMRDREARKRQLFVRRYAVIPITKVCGLVEWIDNLQSLRAIFYDAYSRFGSLDKKAMSSLQLNMREWEDKRTEERRKQGKKPKRTGLEVTEDERMTATQWTKRFKVVVLEKVTPPCFGQWFLQEYRDPITWFTARLSFVRSCAVMSMIGYILGLGDRHLENILLDTRTGQVIHVDLSMLFNAGETLPVPEAVPFRLTQNMIDAMGPTGHDGVFRKACEATMRVMSENKDALVSVLQTLAYDPGVEAIGGRSAQNRPISISSGEKEIKNEMVLKHCKKVEDRLDGIVDTDTIESRIPVSISGHVKILIDQATNIERLSKMYFGWTPFL